MRQVDTQPVKFGVLRVTDGRLEFNLSESPCTDFQEEESGAPLKAISMLCRRCITDDPHELRTTVLQVIGMDVAR